MELAKMPLDQQKSERILNELKSLDVETRLKGIEEARKMFVDAFSGEMTPQQYAYSAMVIEQYYNIIREELRVSQIRIKKDLGATPAKEKPAAKAKAKTTKTPQMDMTQMMAAFAAFNKGGSDAK